MADRMVQRQKRCMIKKSHFEKAQESLRAACGMGEMPVEDLSGKHFSFVEPEEIMQAKNFEQALSAIRFAPIFDAEGNICELHFIGEKQGDEHIFLKALAPFVEKGSCLSFVLEEGILMEWTFDGNDVIYSEREEE